MLAAPRPTREELLAYAVGKLSDADSDRVAAFVDSDPECQAMLATLDGADDTLVGQLRSPEADDPFAAESHCDAALARAKDLAESDAASAESLALGTLGEYRLLEKLGQGGMGTVYKALHTKLDRVVAVKVIAKERMNDPQAVARFEREMKAIGQLDHPGIVAAFDAREIDGVPVLIMEYVDGMDLGRLVRRHGPVVVADACELLRRTALALQYAHEHGLVHRDVKPSNVMLTRSGDVKLLDLGLAREKGISPIIAAGSASQDGPQKLDLSPFSRGLTNTGQAMGTADYMAPEQVAAPQTVDIRADVYSLGCTLFKLLSGRAPYDGTDCGGTLDKLAAHTDRPVPRIADAADVPEPLAAAVDRMLSKSPDARPATPAVVAETLAPFCKGHDLPELLRRAEAQSSPRAAEHSPQPLPAARRWKLITTVIGLMLFSFALGTAFGILITIRHGDRQTTVEVPDGANVDIGEDGNVDVSLPPGAAAGSAAAAPGTTTPDEKAIEGTWAVVSSSCGNGWSYFSIPPDLVPREVAPDQEHGNRDETAGDAARVIFSGGRFKVRGKRAWMKTGDYQINPHPEPKWIDIRIADWGTLKGIYKREGDCLTVCVTAENLRPTEFWSEFGSNRELLILRRIGDVETYPDERTILGDWHVVKVAAERVRDGYRVYPPNGAAGRADEPFSRWLSEATAITIDKSSLGFLHGSHSSSAIDERTVDEIKAGPIPYGIDPTGEPATIDVTTWQFPLTYLSERAGEPSACSLRGIYRLQGERLTLRLAVSRSTAKDDAAAPRPNSFDSQLGEDEFELVLSRTKPAEKPVAVVPLRESSPTADHLDFRLALTREMMPNPPAFDLQKRPEGGLAWFQARDDIGENLVSAEHEGRRYVLLSTKPDEVLLGGRYGPPDWKLASVGLTRDERGKPMLQLELDEAGGKRLAKLTGGHIGRRMAVLVDDRVVTAPIIKSAIANKVAISGNFDMLEVEAIQKALAAGIETPPAKKPVETGEAAADERQ